jgi:hypothetical protein
MNKNDEATPCTPSSKSIHLKSFSKRDKALRQLNQQQRDDDKKYGGMVREDVVSSGWHD